MRRREFMHATLAGALTVTPVGTFGSVCAGSRGTSSARAHERLIRACRDGARTHRVTWNPKVIRRVCEEASDITTLGCQDLFYSLSHALRNLRRRGGWVAPCSGSFGTSLITYLLGITTVNPLACGWHFIPIGRPDIEFPFFDLEFDLRHLPAFSREAGVSNFERLGDGDPPLYYGHLGRFPLLISGIKDLKRSNNASRLNSALLRLESPMKAYLTAYGPRDYNDLALAVRLFSSARSERYLWKAILEGRQAHLPALSDSRRESGFLLFEDDAISLICEKTGASKYEALRYMDASTDPDSEGAHHMRDVLMGVARKTGRSVMGARECLHYVIKQQGFYLFSRPHCLSTGLMLFHPRRDVRHHAVSFMLSGVDDTAEWAWDLVDFTRGVVG